MRASRDRRRRPNREREGKAGRRAVGRAPRGPARDGARASSSSASGHGPGDWSTTSSAAASPRRATSPSTSPARRRSSAGFPESVAGHHGRPAVRLEPAGGALRGPGRHRRRVRHRRRLRGRVDEPGADRDAPPSAATRSVERMHARYRDGLVNQGVSAELVAERWKLDREDARRVLGALAPPRGRDRRGRRLRPARSSR